MRIPRKYHDRLQPEERRRGPNTKPYGHVDDPAELPPLPAADPAVAVEIVDQQVTALDAICATALASGFGLRTACRLILAEHGPTSKRLVRYDRRQVWTTLTRLNAEWTADFKEFAHDERARQVERLRQDLARQRSKANPSFQAIARHEELLGRIMGTLQPIKVEVDVLATLKTSIAMVLVDLTEDEKDRMVQEQLELEAMAGVSHAAE
jgi:hypothetical protein